MSLDKKNSDAYMLFIFMLSQRFLQHALEKLTMKLIKRSGLCARYNMVFNYANQVVFAVMP